MDLYNLKHTAKLVVDFRTETSEPLIRADYGIKNIPLNIPRFQRLTSAFRIDEI